MRRESAPLDAEKIRRIFRSIVEGEVEEDEFEDLCSQLSHEELLLLRELAVQARCASITALAEKGFPHMAPWPN